MPLPSTGMPLIFKPVDFSRSAGEELPAGVCGWKPASKLIGLKPSLDLHYLWPRESMVFRVFSMIFAAESWVRHLETRPARMIMRCRSGSLYSHHSVFIKSLRSAGAPTSRITCWPSMPALMSLNLSLAMHPDKAHNIPIDKILFFFICKNNKSTSFAATASWIHSWRPINSIKRSGSRATSLSGAGGSELPMGNKAECVGPEP